MIPAFARMVRDESGQGLVEYAIILTLIAAVAVVALRFLGGNTGKLYSNASNATNGIGS
jgi:pilus assembly protein Flp/PilA